MRLVEQRIVPTSQTEAFRYAADFSNTEEWDPGVVSSARFGNESPGLGARFDLVVRFGSSTIPMTYEITVFQPDSRVILIGSGENLEAIDDIRFSTSQEGTVIDYTADLTFSGIMRFMTPFIKPAMDRMGERALDGLASALSA